MKYLTLISIMIFSGFSHANLVKTTPGKYFDYYHMKYELVAGEYQLDERYGFNAGGQFSVLIPKEKFPIPAPNCNKNIIVRMPYSQNEDKKRQLYEDLKSSRTTTVVLELNPYVRVLTGDKEQFELTYCNVFFRHKNGDYYDSL